MNNSEEGKIIKNFYYLILIVIALYLAYLLKDVLIPFALGGLLAYALSPVVQLLNSRGLSWKLSVVIVFVAILVFFLSLFIFLVPEVISQFRTLTFQWPQYSETLIEKIIEGLDKLDERYPDSNISQAVESFLTNISTNLQNYLTHVISGIPNLVSVSYTHLDVYKRQIILKPNISWKNARTGKSTGKMPGKVMNRVKMCIRDRCRDRRRSVRPYWRRSIF